MATWKEISVDSLFAAKELLAAGRWRSSTSRAYYTIYACAASQLTGRATFPPGRDGPSHEALPDMIYDFLTKLSIHDRMLYSTICGQMYVRRIYADYRPSMTVDQQLAREAVIWCEAFLKVMEAAYG